MLQSFFNKKRKPEFSSNKYEPAPGKQLRNENHSVKVKREKPGKKDAPKVRDNLKGSKFRLLNELLYTNNSTQANEFFSENKDMFTEYHEGFTQQMKTWPVNPVNIIIKELASEPMYNNAIVCDLGCGEGKIYDFFVKRNQIQTLYDGTQKPADEKPTKENPEDEEEGADHNVFKEILSFDLVSVKPHIQACDIAKLPLDNKSIDVAVFSLALMGLNYIDFIIEAHRCLKMGGHLIIAEVISRIPDNSLFVQMIKALGFNFVKYIKKNSFFITLIFKKADNRPRRRHEKLRLESKDNFKSLPKRPDFNNFTFEEVSKLLLTPCIYKRR